MCKRPCGHTIKKNVPCSFCYGYLHLKFIFICIADIAKDEDTLSILTKNFGRSVQEADSDDRSYTEAINDKGMLCQINICFHLCFLSLF